MDDNMTDAQKIRIARSINWKSIYSGLEDTLSSDEMAYEKMILGNNATLDGMKERGEIDEATYACLPHDYRGAEPCHYCADGVRVSKTREMQKREWIEKTSGIEGAGYKPFISSPRPAGKPMPEGAHIEPPKIVEKPINWSKVDMSLKEPLTPHEIAFAKIVEAQSIEELESATRALEARVRADGGWHGGRTVAVEKTSEVAA